MTLLFRLLFVLYAESSHFLPVDNETYQRHSLTELVAEAHKTKSRLSLDSTALWKSFTILVGALRAGNPAWGVPAYNGALFAAADFEGAELLESLELADPYFARVLLAVGRDTTTGHGVDYSSLEVGHLGHIYEALLSLRLSVADRHCATTRQKTATYPTKVSRRLPSKPSIRTQPRTNPGFLPDHCCG